MREFGNKCEIVGIDRLGLIWEIVSLLAWEMNNRELKLKEVDEDNKKSTKDWCHSLPRGNGAL